MFFFFKLMFAILNNLILKKHSFLVLLKVEALGFQTVFLQDKHDSAHFKPFILKFCVYLDILFFSI